MRADEFSKMRALDETHWWFQGRRRLLRNLVGKLKLRDALILDAGCGTGFAREELGKAGTVIGLDALPEAFAPESDGAGCMALIERAPFRGATFDLIVALDLLEHLEDDEQALREIYRICKPGGYLFVTVPAYQWAWSRHDEALGHRRRYSAADLAEKVRRAGFTLRRLSYTVTTIFLPAMAYRLVRRRSGHGSDLFPVPEPANSLLGALIKLESRLVWNVNFPFGLTVLLLAYREQNGRYGETNE